MGRFRTSRAPGCLPVWDQSVACHFGTPVTVGTIGWPYSCSRASPTKSTPLISIVSRLARYSSLVPHTGVMAHIATLVAGTTRKRARHCSEPRNVRTWICFEEIHATKADKGFRHSRSAMEAKRAGRKSAKVRCGQTASRRRKGGGYMSADTWRRLRFDAGLR